MSGSAGSPAATAVMDVTEVEGNSAGIVPAVQQQQQEQVSPGPESAGTFLQEHGMGFLSSTFLSAGFQSTEDILALTPRKFKQLGVDELGTHLRLSRLIKSETDKREFDRNSARVRVQGEVVEFRMSKGSTIADLSKVVARQIGIPEASFCLRAPAVAGDPVVT